MRCSPLSRLCALAVPHASHERRAGGTQRACVLDAVVLHGRELAECQKSSAMAAQLWREQAAELGEEVDEEVDEEVHESDEEGKEPEMVVEELAVGDDDAPGDALAG